MQRNTFQDIAALKTPNQQEIMDPPLPLEVLQLYSIEA